MEQGLIPQSWMSRRIALLEQERERNAAYEQPWNWWSYRVYPTCPPSTSVRVPGSNMTGDCFSRRGKRWEISSDIYDLTNIYDTGLTIIFDSAYYYMAYVLHLYNAGEDNPTIGLYVHSDWIEHETAAEAENSVYRSASTGLTIDGEWYDEWPLCVVIIRNNGIVGQPGQFMPIDNVNRGRSYIWHDIRPRFFVGDYFYGPD